MIADLSLWFGVIALMLYVLYSSSGWEVPAKMLPQSFACAGLIAAFGFLIFSYLGKIPPLNTESSEPFPEAMRQIVWLVFLVIGVTFIGMLPAIGLFVFCYMTIEGRARPINTIIIIIPFLFGIWFLFHELLHIPWPQSFLGDLFPGMRRISGNMI